MHKTNGFSTKRLSKSSNHDSGHEGPGQISNGFDKDFTNNSNLAEHDPVLEEDKIDLD